MKTRTTKKEVNNSHGVVICVPYGYAQRMLNCENPYGYTCGADGWHADIYSVGYVSGRGAVAIVTGYQAFGTVKPSYNLLVDYERRAWAIIDETDDYTERRERLLNLVHDFIGDALREHDEKQQQRKTKKRA